MKVAAAVRFLLVVLAVTAVAARDLREGRSLLYGHHCEDCEYHKYCNPTAASAAAAASNGDASAAAAAASSDSCYEGYFSHEAAAAAASASSGRHLLESHHCEGCEYHKYCNSHAAAAAAASSGGDASAAAAAASSGGCYEGYFPPHAVAAAAAASSGRHLLGNHHCKGCEYHKYCNSHAAAAAASASGGDASAAAAAASSGIDVSMDCEKKSIKRSRHAAPPAAPGTSLHETSSIQTHTSPESSASHHIPAPTKAKDEHTACWVLLSLSRGRKVGLKEKMSSLTSSSPQGSTS
ncbi:MAG: hypothetical protein FRX49_00345 [Trebouxia sp. A1-2]|nr:MAG: hypothetical protein FRX49_00345 [Trebouxia sp. A1-2]